MRLIVDAERSGRELYRLFEAAFAALALLLLVVGGAEHALAQAARPSTVNPTADSVKEKQLLEALKPGQGITGRVSIPDTKSGEIEQPQGRVFLAEHNRNKLFGGLAIIAALVGTTLFYLIAGKIKIAGGRAEFVIQRFAFIERVAHWLTASAFVLLALTGMNMAFGRSLLLPLVGHDVFTSLAQSGKFIHNYVGFAFMVGLVLMFVLWAARNIPKAVDVRWFLQGGGIVGSAHPPAGKFNGGQKVLFWTVILGGAALVYTGLMLMFPFQFSHNVADMQWYNVWHGLIGLVMGAVIIGHIYIGTIGMEGAFEAMGTGDVDLNWAKAHHSLWVEDVLKHGTKPTPTAPHTPAE